MRGRKREIGYRVLFLSFRWCCLLTNSALFWISKQIGISLFVSEIWTRKTWFYLWNRKRRQHLAKIILEDNVLWTQCFCPTTAVSSVSFFPRKLCILNLEEASFEGKTGHFSCWQCPYCTVSAGRELWWICDRGSSHSWTAWTQATLLYGCFLITLGLTGTHCGSCLSSSGKPMELIVNVQFSEVLRLLSSVPWYVFRFLHPLKACTCLSSHSSTSWLSSWHSSHLIPPRAKWQKHNLNCSWVYSTS